MVPRWTTYVRFPEPVLSLCCLCRNFGVASSRLGNRKTRHRGIARVEWLFNFALAGYNLAGMRNLVPAPA
jgi:hypothetical protein